MSETAVNPWDSLEGPSTRTPRSLENRERSSRRQSWAPPQLLPDPQPQDGFVFKWVRAASRGQDDKANFQKRLREGWEAVNAEEHPELMIELNVSQQSGLVEVGGLILCKMPQEFADQRNAYYQRHAADQLEAAEDNYMRDSDERMKKIRGERNRRVFGDTVNRR